MDLLMHTCCGVCFMYPYERYKDKYNLTSFFYNPNIHPADEFIRRLEALKELTARLEVGLIAADYKPEEYFTAVSPEFRETCAACYQLRLKMTAREAQRSGFNAFATTLAVSPYQNQEAVRAAGLSAAAGAGVEFVYEDLRSGFDWARSEAKARDMYRQAYCGCVFSDHRKNKKRLTRLLGERGGGQ